MALLLAMYQKMRLIREQNQLVLEQSQYSGKISRIEKNIQRTQKRYTSLIEQLDKKAQMMKTQAKVAFNNMYGLGVQGTSSLTSFGGMSQFVMGRAAQILQQGVGKDDPITMDNDEFQQYYTTYMQNGGSFYDKSAEKDEETNQYPLLDGIDPDKVKAFMYALNAANQQQQWASMQCQNMSAQYDNNVSVWVDAQRAQLEAEQDAALEPLNYQQTMMELDKEHVEMRLKRIQAELQAYDQLVSKEAENAAPKFGLS